VKLSEDIFARKRSEIFFEKVVKMSSFEKDDIFTTFSKKHENTTQFTLIANFANICDLKTLL
jgi:hypothetical protein